MKTRRPITTYTLDLLEDIAVLVWMQHMVRAQKKLIGVNLT
ncbi:hypothetical protein [Nostoc sp.]|nr:hypothetical protein [Nostoc sp. S13]